MKRLRILSFLFSFGLITFSTAVLYPQMVFAATCDIAIDTVIDQDYIDGNGCTAINITANVSTTWLGTVDLGGGVVTVEAGNTMTMGRSSRMVLGTGDDVLVQSGAVIRATQEDPNGISISARNIDVQGQLNASSGGCRRAEPFGGDGYGVNVSTGMCEYREGGFGVGGGGSGAGGRGGSHAGMGGAGMGTGYGTVIYGSSLVPTLMGSGGGTGYYTSAFGGSGGGVVQVTSTGILRIDGVISADGENGMYEGIYNGGGGGAGGSVLIHASTLAGSGSVHANGGAGNHGGGGGSGGRVAVYYGSLSDFSLSNVAAAAGAGGLSGGWGDGRAGEAGTVFLLDRLVDDYHGTMTIMSGFDFPSNTSYVRDHITIGSGAYLRCSSNSSLTVSSTDWLVFDQVRWVCSSEINDVTLASLSGLSTTGTSFSFSAATSVAITAPTWTNVTTTIAVTQSGSRASFAIGSDLTLRDFSYLGGNQGSIDADGGILTFPNPYALHMVSSTLATSVSSTQLTALSIDSRSTINATGKGCRGSVTTENGFGPDSTTGICTFSTSGYGSAGNGGGGGGGGAAHAGIGGAAVGGGAIQSTTYGSSTHPTLAGSGGGGGYWLAAGAGGDGGGRVYLVISGTVTIEGGIIANGGSGVFTSYNGGGGGSGGSIYLRAQSLAGAGSITANGGLGGAVGGGGGGGGRIAMYYTDLSFSGTSSTDFGVAGTGAQDGGIGSIYTFQLNTAPSPVSSLAPSSLVSGGATSTNTPTLSFTLADPDVSDTLRYRIQIDNNSDFSSPIVEYRSALGAQGVRSFQVGQSLSGGVYTYGSVSQTLSDGSYYWRVQAIDPYSETSSYTTANSGGIAFVIDTVARSVQFNASSVSVAETVPSASVLLVLDTTHFEPVTVTYAVSGTASSSSDYLSLSSGTATIPAGETTTSLSFVILDDGDREPNETIILTLSSPMNAVLGVNDTYVYTILDNDTPAAPTQNGGGASTGVPGGTGSGALLPGHIGTIFPREQNLPSNGVESTPSNPLPAFPVSIPLVTRSELSRDAHDFSVLLDEADVLRLGQFMDEGSSDLTHRLGSGERRAMVRDLLDTLNRAPSIADLERLASGQIPLSRNLTEERLQLPRVRQTFRSIYGHDPNFQNEEENLAWNTLMYRIRFPRDLNAEREGIVEFQRLFRRDPRDPFQWATVRVMGYVNN